MTNKERVNEDFKPVSNSNYLKAQEGDTKLRILTSPIQGYEYYDDNSKPHRSREKPTSTPDIQKDGKLKKFWAIPVYNYDEEALQIWVINQITIQDKLYSLAIDEDFGNPTEYDIKLNKTVKDKKTIYDIKPLSKKAFEHKEVIEMAELLDMEQLYIGENPFESAKPV